jgi:hypothetical protein
MPTRSYVGSVCRCTRWVDGLVIATVSLPGSDGATRPQLALDRSRYGPSLVTVMDKQHTAAVSDVAEVYCLAKTVSSDRAAMTQRRRRAQPTPQNLYRFVGVRRIEHPRVMARTHRPRPP